MSSVNDEVAVGDLGSNAKGTGARKNGGKVDFTLVPLHLLAGCTRVLAAGVLKYNKWNWDKGMPWSACVGPLVRHFIKWYYLREDHDEETGEHHLDHMICNLLFLRHYELTFQEGDDRPPEMASFNTAEVMEWFSTKFDESAYRERNQIND